MAKSNKVNSINTSRVLKAIWQHEQISRIDLARLLDLDKSSITKIVSSLIDKGILQILEEGDSTPQGGRRPIYLGLQKDFGIILGIEIQPRSYHLVGINLYGKILFEHTDNLELDHLGLKGAFLSIYEKAKSYIGKCKIPLIGIGVGVSGIIDIHKGIIRQSFPLDINQPYFFYEEVKDHLKVPLVIENDANCGCFSELIRNKAQRISNFLYILSEFRQIQTSQPSIENLSIGLGLVIEEQVLHGENYSAGEFRSINWNDSNHSQFSLSRGATLEISQMIEELGANIALLVNTLGLDKIVLSGELEKHISQVEEVFQKAIQKNWAYPARVNCLIKTSPLKDRAIAYGAASVFLEKLFSLPNIEEEKDLIPRGSLLFDQIIESQ